MMLHYSVIRHFPSTQHGYYCSECLAARLNLPPEEIRRSLGRRALPEAALAYRLCQSCLDEKGVFALRRSA